MKYVPFGGTGIKASSLIFGTWYLPHEDTQDESGVFPVSRERTISVINKAIEVGINVIDTADVYRGVYKRGTDNPDYEGVGRSEKILGEAIKGHDRESLVLVTKVTGRTGMLPNDSGHNRKHIRKAVSDSLERMDTDYIDVYLLHAPDSTTSLENALRSMNHLIEDGSILHYGISNFQPEQIEEMFSICRQSGLEPPSVIQDVYNLINRDFENGKLRLIEKYNMGAMIYSPLAQGVLAGRYSSGSEGVARKDYDGYFAEKAPQLTSQEIVNTLSEISVARSVSMAKISLAWLMSRSRNIFPIVGASKTEQLVDNAGSVDLELSAEDLARLDGKGQ